MGEVVDPLVRRPEGGVDAGQGSDDLHVGAVQRALDRDEVERTPRGEHRERGGDGHEPGLLQPEGDRDQVLLGHADVHEPVGERLRERGEPRHPGDIGG